MTGFWIGLAIGIGGGGALGWFGREPLTQWWKGAEKFVGELEDQARSLRARLK